VKLGLIADNPFDPENVEIDDSRTPALAPSAPQLALDREQAPQELARRPFFEEECCRVQEWRLGRTYRLRLVDRRADYRTVGKATEPADARAKILETIPEV
jgi:hypothetical protein